MVAPDRSRAELDAALEELRPRIRRHVRTLVRNAADAEDLVQEALLRAHRQIDALRSPEALAGWLYRIATNLCLDFLRPKAGRARLGAVEEPVDGIEVASDLPALDELVEHSEMMCCGEELLARLPPAYRTVLLLHDFQGRTSGEIARSLRCAPGAVKIRLHRARARFRALVLECCDLYHDGRGALVGACKQPAPGAEAQAAPRRPSRSGPPGGAAPRESRPPSRWRVPPRRAGP